MRYAINSEQDLAVVQHHRMQLGEPLSPLIRRPFFESSYHVGAVGTFEGQPADQSTPSVQYTGLITHVKEGPQYMQVSVLCEDGEIRYLYVS